MTETTVTFEALATLRAALDAEATPANRRAYERARNALATKHHGLVVTFARRYAKADSDLFDELVQEGSIALLQAIERYDPARGSFPPYASPYISFACGHGVGSDRLVSVPTKVRYAARRAEKIRDHHTTAGAPTSEQVAERLGLAESEVDWLSTLSFRPVSLENPRHEPHNDAADGLSVARWDAALCEFLGALEPHESAVLRLRFGMGAA